MAFKMKGSPFQRNFGIGSPLKQEEKAYGGTRTWSEGEDAAGRHNQNLNDLVRERNKHDKNTNPYNIAQNKINQFLGSSVRHAVESDETTNVRTNTTDKSDKVVVKNTETGDKDKIKTKYYDDDKEQIKKEKIVTKDGDGTEKTVVKYDKDGNVIKERGYTTGDNKNENDNSTKTKKELREEKRNQRREDRENKKNNKKNKKNNKKNKKNNKNDNSGGGDGWE